MKNNFFSSKKPKIGLIALLLVFCGLLSQTVLAQLQGTFTWKTTGGVDNNWTTPGNWTKTGTTTGAGAADTYPGETPGRRYDAAVVATGLTAVTPVIPARVDPYSVYRLDINNSSSFRGGAVVTVESGATLNVGDQNSNQIRLAGGTLINNGTVNSSTTGAGFSGFPATGIICLTPTSIPTVATEYGYKGTGTLNISLPNANFANSACIYSSGTSTDVNIANATYKIELNNASLSFNQASTAVIGAIRALGVVAANYAPKLVISGTGATIGSVGTPSIGSLIGFGSGTSVTVDTGTTLTFHSVTANTNNGIISSFATTVRPTNFTNNGTINILGGSTKSGFYFTQGTPATGGVVHNITNSGTITVEVNSTGAHGAFASGDGGGYNSLSALNVTNSGTMNLKNTVGSALNVSQAFNAQPMVFGNSGTLNLDGSTFSGGATFALTPEIKGYINNSGQLNTNHELANVVFTNTSTGTIAFANAASAATTNALVTGTFATNDGKIQTGSAKLNDLGLIAAYSATSIIEPGGTGYGIADFNKTGNAVVLGKLAVQVAGNTAAGTDYDQIKNSFTDGGFDVTGATLDVTSISGTASPVDIIVANGAGTITGPFASVTGLTSGWSVNYGVAGKVQLVYSTATTWNGTAWSDGTPDATKDAIIDGDLSSTGTLNTKNLTVNNTRTLTVASGSVTVAEALVNNGAIVVANNANLRQTTVANTNSGSGTATVNRNSAAIKRLDYTMWSSPVSGSQTLEGFSPNTSRVPNRFYTYNGGTAFATIATTSVFTPGMGYLIRMPNDASTSPTEYAGQFTGTTFNNGTITVSGLTSDSYYSVGNPYPSTISADAFLTDNPGTLYFWRKTNAAVGGAYATYNSVGPVAAASGAGSEVPNGTIQVGQGFIAKTGVAATSLVFTNAMRLGTASSQFFKTKNTVAKSRVWLDLTDTGGLFSQALVGYLDGATVGVDNGYDGKYLSDSATDAALTSIVDGGEYTIQGRPAFDATDVVALGFKAGAAGDFTIAINKKDGALATQDIYLVDSKTGIETDLNAGSYTFAAEAGVDNTRFSLKYQKTLKVIDAALDNNSVSVYLNDGAIHINSKSAAINSVKVFDVQGRLLAEQRNVNANTAVISNLRAKNQILIVNVVGEDNSEVSKKIMN